MFRSYKDRDPYDATHVFVYRNLHAALWSIMAKDGKHAGQVVAHANHVMLESARWRVNEAGRQRVIAERRKNVHAGVFGVLVREEPDSVLASSWERVSYNPYRAGQFVLAEVPDHSRVDSSRYAMLDVNGKAWIA